MKNIADNTDQSRTEISGSYRTPDGKAQIDFEITTRNGYPEYTSTGHFDGSSGQCLDSILTAYPADRMVHDLHSYWKAFHMKEINSPDRAWVRGKAELYPAVSFYETQAQDFLTRNGLKMRITLSNSKTAPWERDGDEERNHHRVTISRDGWKPDRRKSWEKVGQGEHLTTIHATDLHPSRNRLVFDFWGSIADARKGKSPSEYDVLDCISGDAYTPETFADFCGEYGYEADSIKALQQFRRCDRFAKRLRAFFTESELTELSEIR